MLRFERIITLTLSLFVCFSLFAQGVIKGRVLSKSTNESMPFVNVKVTKTSDGKFVAGSVTDDGGAFHISGLQNGDYQMEFSYIGYKTTTKEVKISEKNKTHTLTAVYMSEDSHVLQEVKVTGQRSEMKLEVDRKVFTVDQMISNAGGSATDALNNIPSVEVDNDGNVSLRGSSSVEVWINGKASGLTTDNRGEILQQLPAESIEKIEVIDNPSSKYSAEGTAGIINIVLKRDRKAGILWITKGWRAQSGRI